MIKKKNQKDLFWLRLYFGGRFQKGKLRHGVSPGWCSSRRSRWPGREQDPGQAWGPRPEKDVTQALVSAASALGRSSLTGNEMIFLTGSSQN